MMAPGQAFESLSPSPNSRPSLYRNRRESEESIATELCDGPLLEDNPRGEDAGPRFDRLEGTVLPGIDRELLIERLKKRQKEEWAHAGNLSAGDSVAFYHHELASKIGPSDSGQTQQYSDNHLDALTAGLQIQRPRSALHSGDFSRENSSSDTHVLSQTRTVSIPISTFPPRPGSPLAAIKRTKPKPSISLAFSPGSRLSGPPSDKEAKEPSLRSASPKYVLKPPTSPLVWGSSDFESGIGESPSDEKPSKVNRRHTFTPLSSSSNHNDYSQLTAAARTPGPLRREETFPLQSHGHRHRRSFGGSRTFQVDGSPSMSSSLRSRAPSLSSDASPRQSSMVGSYEESILRGRMSGMPSHPLTFEAGIGALGKQGCKPMMPEHVRVDFPAVFYSWNDGQGRVASVHQEPSPYVGRIDLEHSLPPPRKKEKRRKREEKRIENEERSDAEPSLMNRNSKKRKHLDADRHPTPSKRTGDGPELGGAYRIPKTGSLQLIVKNPNKTAVKVFIVPYDLDGMLPSQRTWIRQRLYSAGPVVEKPISSRSGNEASPAGRTGHHANGGKPTLRYLIHFKICCTGKDRFYLYDEIRVVFANRVPDNKEKLRSEVMMPEPKFMPFKATQVLASSAELNSPASSVHASGERVLGRGSHGIGSYNTSRNLTDSSISRLFGDDTQLAFEPSMPPALVHPDPQNYRRRGDGTDQDMAVASIEGFRSNYIVSQTREPWRQNHGELLSSPGEHSYKDKAWNDQLACESDHKLPQKAIPDPFAKLARDDVRFGGYFGRSGTPEPGEGLIAKRLRSLEIDMEE